MPLQGAAITVLFVLWSFFALWSLGAGAAAACALELGWWCCHCRVPLPSAAVTVLLSECYAHFGAAGVLVPFQGAAATCCC